MSLNLSEIWRYPLKSHGREPVGQALLEVGKCLPYDRRWAVAHEASDATGDKWVPCVNFSRGSKAPGLMAIEAAMDEASGRLTLTHPELGSLSFDPETEADRLIAWAAPVMPADRAASARIVRVPDRGMTDTDYPSVSLGGLASHRALEGRMGRELSRKRWRLNLWVDGLAPWEEFDLIGHEIRIGDARLAVEERIVRCLATTANPETGRRDADTLGALEAAYGHQDFGVYARVVDAGRIRPGDKIEVIR